jgi:hypothetical protein
MGENAKMLSNFTILTNSEAHIPSILWRVLNFVFIIVTYLPNLTSVQDVITIINGHEISAFYCTELTQNEPTAVS